MVIVNTTNLFFLGVSVHTETVTSTEATVPGTSEVRIHLHACVV